MDQDAVIAAFAEGAENLLDLASAADEFRAGGNWNFLIRPIEKLCVTEVGGSQSGRLALVANASAAVGSRVDAGKVPVATALWIVHLRPQ